MTIYTDADGCITFVLWWFGFSHAAVVFLYPMLLVLPAEGVVVGFLQFPLVFHFSLKV